MGIPVSPNPQIYQAVNAQAMKYGVPTAIWEDVAYTESGFNTNQTHLEKTGYYSVGLFQLEQVVGQGGTYSTQQLQDPGLNASLAMPSIGKAWGNLKGSFDPNSDTWWQQFASQSGHPGGTPGQSVTNAEAKQLKANYPGPSTGVPTRGTDSSGNALPWYCVNIFGNIVNVMNPSVPCSVQETVDTSVAQAVTDPNASLIAFFSNFFQAALPPLLERIGLFIFALILVVVGFIMLVHP